MLNRRQMLCCGAGMAALAVGRRAFPDPASGRRPQTGLGVVVYCRGLLAQAAKRRNPKADLFEPFSFLEHCRQLGAGGMQFPLGMRDEAYARRLRQRAAEWGMYVEGCVAAPAGEADLARFEAEIRTAASAGAAAVRTVLFPDGATKSSIRSSASARRSARRGARWSWPRRWWRGTPSAWPWRTTRTSARPSRSRVAADRQPVGRGVRERGQQLHFAGRSAAGGRGPGSLGLLRPFEGPGRRRVCRGLFLCRRALGPGLLAICRG